MPQCPSVGHWVSNHDPLHFIKRDLVPAAIVEAGGSRRLVRGHLLRHFELAAVLQVSGNSGCAERMAPDQSLDAGSRSPAPDHEVHLRLGDPPGCELLRLTSGCAEEGSAFLASDAGSIEVGRHVLFEVVMCWHLVTFSPFFMQPNPPAPTLEVPVLDIHASGGAHAGEGEHHEADERAIAEAD